MIWPWVKFLVHDDSYNARPEALAYREANEVDCIFRLGTPATLRRHVEALEARPADRFAAGEGSTVRATGSKPSRPCQHACTTRTGPVASARRSRDHRQANHCNAVIIMDQLDPYRCQVMERCGPPRASLAAARA